MNLSGKVALVTGSSKGIGYATVLALAKNGCHVIINYLNDEAEANKLKSLITQSYQVKALVIKANVANEDEVIKMKNAIIKEFGKLDILVSNAGIAIDNDFKDKTADEFRKVLDVNLVGTFLVNKYFGQLMYTQKQGIIINISSTNGIDTNNPLAMDYDASKAGVISLTHNFAQTYAPYVRVNSVAPGWTNTKAVEAMSPTHLEDEKQKNMLKRFAEPEEIANVICFLASDEASYINNTIIRVDGGIIHE